MTANGPRSQTGSVMLVVLFLSLLCALMASASIVLTRAEIQRSRAALDHLRALASMDGAAIYAAHEMARSRRNETVLPFDCTLNSHVVRVQSAPPATLTDLNLAGESQLRSVFVRSGMAQDDATTLASQVLDWRDADDLSRPSLRGGFDIEGLPDTRNGNFVTKKEILLLPGVSEDVYAQLDPHITVFGLSSPGSEVGLLFPGTRVTLSSAIQNDDDRSFIAPRWYLFRGGDDPSDPVGFIGVARGS